MLHINIWLIYRNNILINLIIAKRGITVWNIHIRICNKKIKPIISAVADSCKFDIQFFIIRCQQIRTSVNAQCWIRGNSFKWAVQDALESTWYFFQTIQSSACRAGRSGRKQRLILHISCGIFHSGKKNFFSFFCRKSRHKKFVI